jgi:hypothetical protein
MKWLYLALTVLSLWVAFNALFMLPGKYDAFNFWAAAVAILFAISSAWLGSRKFVNTESRSRRRFGSLWRTPPTIVCITGLVLIAIAGILRLGWGRWP